MKQKSKASLKPQRITNVSWYYEYDNKIIIVHVVLGVGTYEITIPKRKLMKSLERMNTAERES